MVTRGGHLVSVALHLGIELRHGGGAFLGSGKSNACVDRLGACVGALHAGQHADCVVTLISTSCISDERRYQSRAWSLVTQ
jgi:hypothetical protein